MMIPPDGYTVRYSEALPLCCRGVTVVDHEGFANIYLNPRYDLGHQKAAIKHELAHVMNDDAYNQDSIPLIEARAAGILPQPSPPAQGYAAFLERAYSRGLAFFGLQRDDPFWDKLFDIWDFRAHRDRYEGVIIDGVDRYSKRQAGQMVKRIFAQG